MGHNLNFKDGKAAMAYTGEKPWHGLGTKVDGAMTSAEAIKAASLDWTVEKRQVFFTNGGSDHGLPVMKKVDGRFATVRTDTMEALGVVGKQYRILQNNEAFQFFDAIVGEKLAMYHTAGALGAGERIWLLAKLPGECWITPEDNVEKFLMLTNSHDGYNAVKIMATPIRVVCQNTLNMALSAFAEGGRQRTSVRHTINMGNGIKEIREQLGIADQYFRTFEAISKRLAAMPATGKVVEQLFTDLGLSLDKSKESTRTGNIRYEILKKFESGRGNAMTTTRGTAWALLNGVVEYVDYDRSARGDNAGEKAEGRANSLLFGSGAAMKQKAVDSLMAMAK